METQPKRLSPVYVGTGSDIFMLTLKTGLLTLLTLGIYRFWAKTRVRRYIWSSVKIGGDSGEYTGTGLEKLLGFLVAVVVLAVYLGILQVLLTFAGFSLIGTFTDPANTPAEIMQQLAITYGTLLALLPLMLFAVYRGRRYMLSRTRWRGMRMGMSPGAGGYVLRGLLYYFLVIISLGLLLPLATFKLHKYMVDRQWYGDAAFEQHGKWTKLYRAMLQIGIAFLIMVVGIFATATIGGIGALFVFVGYFWFFYGAIDYSVKSYRYLTDNQTLDGQVTFHTATRTGEIVKFYILGGILIGLLSAVIFLPMALLIEPAMAALFMSFGALGAAIVGAAVYLIVLVVLGAASMALIQQPILAHYVGTTFIDNAEHLDAIQQRSDDSIPDADGFADALDIGGAF